MDNCCKADIIMEFVNQICSAYEAGFTPYPHMTLQQLHRVAQHHVKDEFGIDVDDFKKSFGGELFDRCKTISERWEKPVYQHSFTVDGHTFYADNEVDILYLERKFGVGGKAKLNLLEDK